MWNKVLSDSHGDLIACKEQRKNCYYLQLLCTGEFMIIAAAPQLKKTPFSHEELYTKIYIILYSQDMLWIFTYKKKICCMNHIWMGKWKRNAVYQELSDCQSAWWHISSAHQMSSCGQLGSTVLWRWQSEQLVKSLHKFQHSLFAHCLCHYYTWPNLSGKKKKKKLGDSRKTSRSLSLNHQRPVRESVQ